MSKAAAYTYWSWRLFQFKEDSDRDNDPPERPASVGAKLADTVRRDPFAATMLE